MKRHEFRANSKPGFTVVEVLVALIILTVGMLAMVGAMASNASIMTITNSRMDMLTMAESKVEELRWFAVSSTADTMQLRVGGSLTSNQTSYFDQATSDRGRNFNRRWQVTAGPGTTRMVTLRIIPVTRSRLEIGSLDFNTLIVIERR